MKQSQRMLLGFVCSAVAASVVLWLVFCHRPRGRPEGRAPESSSRERSGVREAANRLGRNGLRISIVDEAGEVIEGASVRTACVLSAPDKSAANVVHVRQLPDTGVGRYRLGPDTLSMYGGFLSSATESLRASIILFAMAEGYVPAREDVSSSLKPGEREVVLLRQPVIFGKVVDAWEKTPLKDVPVIARFKEMYLFPDQDNPEQQPSTTAVSTDGGLFRLELAEAGEVELTADSSKFLTISPPRLVAKAGEVIRGVVLKVKGGLTTVLKGRVLDLDGDPVPSAQVYLVGQGAKVDSIIIARGRYASLGRGWLGSPVRADEEGEYVITIPPDWDYGSYYWFWFDSRGREPVGPQDDWKPHKRAVERLIATAEGHSPGPLNVPKLGRGEVREGLDIILGELEARISGTVWKESGGAASDGKVYLDSIVSSTFKGDELKLFPRRWACSEDGTYSASLPEGEFILMAWVGDQPPPARVRGGRRHREEKQVAPGVWIRDHGDSGGAAKYLKVTAGSSASGVDFLVRDVGYVRGKVVDENGLPWPFGSVRAGNRQAVIQEDGTFEITDLAAGSSYTLDILPNKGALKDFDAFLLEDPQPNREVVTPVEGVLLTISTVGAGKLDLRVIGTGAVPVTSYSARVLPIRIVRSLRSKIAIDRDAAYNGQSARIRSEDGTHTFKKLFPGDYRVQVDVPGSSGGEAVEYVEVFEGQTAFLEVSVEGLWATISGEVVDASGVPVNKCRVRLQKDWLKSTGPLSGSILRSHLDEYRNVGLGHAAKTKEDGKFLFHGVPLGKWVISARPEKSVFQAQELLEVVGDVRGLELEIPKGTGTIYGKITREDGTPMQAWVNISGDEVSAELKAERDGAFQLPDLPAGQYKVSLVTFPTLYTRTVNLEAGQSTEVNFQWGPAWEAPLVVEFDLTSLLNDKLQPEDIVCWATLHLVPRGRPDKFWPRGGHLLDVQEIRSKPALAELRQNSEATVRFAHFE